MDPVSGSDSQYWYSKVAFSRSATIANATSRRSDVDASISKEIPLKGDIVEIKREIIPTSEESIDTETVDRIKTLAQSLTDKKTDIESRIQNVLAKVGFSSGIDDNLKIDIDSKGKILVSGVKDRNIAKKSSRNLVEGTFSKSHEADHTGQQIVEEQLKAAFDGPDLFGPLGVDSSLKTAMGRFLELHEDNFGDTDEFHHSLGFDIKDGMAISAYAYSPEAEAASTAEIGTAVTTYLEASGISDADQLEIEIDDEGKIVLATPIADEALAKQVEGLLDDLNNGLAKATSKEGEDNFESDGSALGNAIGEIAPHLKHVMSHRPGGGHLSVATTDEKATDDEAKLTEQKELFNKNLMIQKGTVPGTRSAHKPFIVRSFERLA